MHYSATYSPEDNKLRLYATCRLDPETYASVKSAGFIWAPKQDLFVAPMWTPAREDLLIELAGEIEDEDKSLVERAEERSERFEDYSEARANDAERARKAVSAIADNIPFGQPILVGHHSERHARRDAEKIESGMRKAVKMWEQSSYWQSRAEGAVRAAKYKELPSVRARRVKTLEAEKRKCERAMKEAGECLALWHKIAAIEDPEKQLATARYATGRTGIGNLGIIKRENTPNCYSFWSAYDVLQPDEQRYTACPSRTVAEVLEIALKSYGRPTTQRWIAHYENRIAYEKAMLAEAGGGAEDRFDIQVGGRVQVRGEWVTVIRVNRSGGRISSVTTNARYVSIRGIDEVSDYQAPTAEAVAAATAVAKQGVLCNYPVEDGIALTKEQWAKIPNDYRGSRKIAATETAGAHRVRYALGCFALQKTGLPVNDSNRHKYHSVYISDEKRKDAPPPDDAPAPSLPPPARIVRASPPKPEPQISEQTHEAFQAMRRSLKAGVQTISAPQLFPTPANIAEEMVEAAEIQGGQAVLEPSAGTGVLVQAVKAAAPNCDLTAVEVNSALFRDLARKSTVNHAFHIDFLLWGVEPLPTAPRFDRILMNPPFENGADIKHIKHAASMLKPGGRLVAICANGPRQNEALKPIASEWRELPSGSFKAQGTGVNVAMMVINAPD